MNWNQALTLLPNTHDREQQKRLLTFLHQEALEGRATGPALVEGVAALYKSTRDPWLSSELKRLQNRVRGRQALGRDLLRLSRPPVGDEEQRRLWEDLKSLKSTYESAQGAEGSLVGTYDIREKIGQGGMSVVFRAVRLADQKEVAIKYLRRKYFDSPAIVARFQRECRLCLSFDHPHIVRVYEVGQHDPGGFMVMEYLPLGGLDAMLGRPEMTPRLSLAVIRQALQALAYIHSRQVVHRDIKLSNLLLSTWAPQPTRGTDDQIQVKLTDFGLSKELPGDGLTTVGTQMGTDLYMAPEQRESPGEVDQRADIYSIGVALYRLVSGRGFPEGDYPLLCELHPGLPAGLDDLLRRCLKQDREERYASAGDVLRDLEVVETEVCESPR